MVAAAPTESSPPSWDQSSAGGTGLSDPAGLPWAFSSARGQMFLYPEEVETSSWDTVDTVLVPLHLCTGRNVELGLDLFLLPHPDTLWLSFFLHFVPSTT